MNKKEILEMHFGSDFHEISQPCYLDHILNAMEEYKEQENKELKVALMETDLYYRNEVVIPNRRICEINFDLLK